MYYLHQLTIACKWTFFLVVGFMCVFVETGCDSGGEETQEFYTPLESLEINDTIIGDGLEVESGDLVSIRYKVETFRDGVLLDDSDRGVLFNVNIDTGVFTFIQGSDDAIEGLNTGILGMKGGGVRQLTIPYALAWAGGIDGVVGTRVDILLEVEVLRRPEFTLLVEGNGAPVDNLNRVTVTYVSEYFTTLPLGATEHVPYTFILGHSLSGRFTDYFPGILSKMAGLHLLLQDMKVGDKFEVRIPPALAIGSEPFSEVPGNTTIEAIVEVIDTF